MTTKATARKFRLRRGEALAEGVTAEGVARARADIRAGTTEAAKPADTVVAAGRARAVGTPDTSPQAEIAAIRQEGLTGRQLRLARRVAQKHGLAPTSDHDAVRLLRNRGINPFERAAILELVPAGAPGQTGAAPATLPQTVTPPRPPAPAQPPSPFPVPTTDGAAEIYRIQQDIARRRRRRSVALLVRLAFFVLLPTLAVGWYFAAVATPMYATESEFVIQQADAAAATGLGGLFAGAGLAVQQDSTTVQSYLRSRDAMQRLDADLGFKAHFQQPSIDRLQRLGPDASDEQAYDLYRRRVEVGYDPSEGILRMEVVAADPEISQAFSEALIGYAEAQVDHLSHRLRGDQMSGARASYTHAETKVAEAQARVLALQEDLGVFDPASESGALLQQITTFEVQLSRTRLELEQHLSNPRPNAARVAALEGEVARLEDLVRRMHATMTESSGEHESLARVSGALKLAEADLATRQLLLQQAAQQLEAARIEAGRQVRYMAVGVRPIAPDEATYPRVFQNTLLALLAFSGLYLMTSLTMSVLREQVSS
jgi:capsular polysaccharide transport system permease protein